MKTDSGGRQPSAKVALPTSDDMKIIRYLDPLGTIGYAAVQPDDSLRTFDGDPYQGAKLSTAAPQVAHVLAPVAPVAFFCIGLNYWQHAAETGSPLPEFPVLFMKNPAALQHPGQPILLPRVLRSDQVDYEGELAVVIGKTCKNVRKADALKYVLGYTCANDISARDWQGKWGGSQWCRGKTFDTFAPLGPCLVTADEIPNPNTLRIRTILNGDTLQDSNTADMIFDVPTLIEFLSGSTTLLAGTVILTGTPQGVGNARKPPRLLKAGDTITVEIEHIGALTNPIREEEAPSS